MRAITPTHDRLRCTWANVRDPLLVAYHDREWGVPVHSERKHFEVLVLSGAQAGLNWFLLLREREGYHGAFDNFDVEKVGSTEARRQGNGDWKVDSCD